MLKRYSNILSFLIILSSTVFVSISVVKTLKFYTDIENIAGENDSEECEFDFEKQEKSLLSSLTFQYDLVLCEIEKTYNFFSQ